MRQQNKKNIKKKEIDEFKCDLCQRIFYRKWSNRERNWTKINEVSYWTEKEIDECKIICRGCLNDWWDKTCRKYPHLITLKKKRLFYQYRYNGLLDEGHELYKD